ncbi:MAG: 23S rRNA (guanine(745)-N(1))-methyltransferase, partial [Thalassotalea sp.]|nr:23S rRNA (guanine(745)-N(1))-methyltransferase [Thalassotalea sp.]
MSIYPQPNDYHCPLCDLALVLNNKTFRCANNHSFDQAKEGYVNLLPVQHKHSKDPGDNKDMVNARRRFLEADYYLPLRQRLVDLYTELSNKPMVVDAGCGEGYYTHAHKTAANTVYGIDIAKNAVRIAAKKYKDCHFSVGSIAKLPFNDGVVDWLFSIYAPIKTQEFARLLNANGYLVTVTPAANHLWQLKELIYETPKPHNVEKQQLDSFELISEENLAYEMCFATHEQALDLLAMTPFAFKTSDSLFAQIKQQPQFKCQADFLIRIYKKLDVEIKGEIAVAADVAVDDD